MNNIHTTPYYDASTFFGAFQVLIEVELRPSSLVGVDANYQPRYAFTARPRWLFETLFLPLISFYSCRFSRVNTSHLP
jgi:hypothetical protein